MNSSNVTLSLSEFLIAIYVGQMRISASDKDCNHATTYVRDRFTRLEEDVVGACAEMAVAKFCKRYFTPGLNTFHKQADLWKDVEVRGSRHKNGCLIIRDNDKDDRKYVFVVVDGTNASIKGWLFGHEAKQEKYLSNPNGYRESWFVPQKDLRPLELKNER